MLGDDEVDRIRHKVDDRYRQQLGENWRNLRDCREPEEKTDKYCVELTRGFAEYFLKSTEPRSIRFANWPLQHMYDTIGRERVREVFEAVEKTCPAAHNEPVCFRKTEPEPCLYQTYHEVVDANDWTERRGYEWLVTDFIATQAPDIAELPEADQETIRHYLYHECYKGDIIPQHYD